MAVSIEVWRGERNTGAAPLPVPLAVLPPCEHEGPVVESCKTCGNQEGRHVRVCLHPTPSDPDRDTCTRQFVSAKVTACERCADYRAVFPDGTAPATAHLAVSADGIGDHLVGLALAAHWRRANPESDLTVVATPGAAAWLSLFEHGARTAEAPAPGSVPVCDLSARGTRHYVEVAAPLPKLLPWPRPLSADARAPAEPYRGAVVLAPRARDAGRSWPLPYWLELERLVTDAGGSCVVLDGPGAGERNRSFRSPVLAGESPERVAAVLCAAAVLVGNESGMAHLAGMLRVPAVVLYAQLDARPIYAHYPTVRLLRGPLSCSGCRWTGPNYRPHCDSLCASLASITPADVFAALSAVAAEAPGYVADPAADRALAALASAVDAGPRGRRGFGRVLAWLAARPNPRVLETGCQRADDDLGAGMSTTVFGRFLQTHGGSLTSVDLSPTHTAFARSRVRGLPVDVVESDSVAYVRNYTGPPLDLVYLDSLDADQPGHAEHALAEARTVLPHLAPGGRLWFDDTWRTSAGWTGKGALAVPWLLSQGWRVEWDGYQVLLGRG